MLLYLLDTLNDDKSMHNVCCILKPLFPSTSQLLFYFLLERDPGAGLHASKYIPTHDIVQPYHKSSLKKGAKKDLRIVVILAWDNMVHVCFGGGMNEYRLALYMVMHQDWYDIHTDAVGVYRYHDIVVSIKQVIKWFIYLQR